MITEHHLVNEDKPLQGAFYVVEDEESTATYTNLDIDRKLLEEFVREQNWVEQLTKERAKIATGDFEEDEPESHVRVQIESLENNIKSVLTALDPHSDLYKELTTVVALTPEEVKEKRRRAAVPAPLGENEQLPQSDTEEEQQQPQAQAEVKNESELQEDEEPQAPAPAPAPAPEEEEEEEEVELVILDANEDLKTLKGSIMGIVGLSAGDQYKVLVGSNPFPVTISGKKLKELGVRSMLDKFLQGEPNSIGSSKISGLEGKDNFQIETIDGMTSIYTSAQLIEMGRVDMLYEFLRGSDDLRINSCLAMNAPNVEDSKLALFAHQDGWCVSSALLDLACESLRPELRRQKKGKRPPGELCEAFTANFNVARTLIKYTGSDAAKSSVQARAGVVSQDASNTDILLLGSMFADILDGKTRTQLRKSVDRGAWFDKLSDGTGRQWAYTWLLGNKRERDNLVLKTQDWHILCQPFPTEKLFENKNFNEPSKVVRLIDTNKKKFQSVADLCQRVFAILRFEKWRASKKAPSILKDNEPLKNLIRDLILSIREAAERGTPAGFQERLMELLFLRHQIEISDDAKTEAETLIEENYQDEDKKTAFRCALDVCHAAHLFMFVVALNLVKAKEGEEVRFRYMSDDLRPRCVLRNLEQMPPGNVEEAQPEVIIGPDENAVIEVVNGVVTVGLSYDSRRCVGKDGDEEEDEGGGGGAMDEEVDGKAAKGEGRPRGKGGERKDEGGGGGDMDERPDPRGAGESKSDMDAGPDARFPVNKEAVVNKEPYAVFIHSLRLLELSDKNSDFGYEMLPRLLTLAAIARQLKVHRLDNTEDELKFLMRGMKLSLDWLKRRVESFLDNMGKKKEGATLANIKLFHQLVRKPTGGTNNDLLPFDWRDYRSTGPSAWLDRIVVVELEGFHSALNDREAVLVDSQATQRAAELDRILKFNLGDVDHFAVADQIIVRLRAIWPERERQSGNDTALWTVLAAYWDKYVQSLRRAMEVATHEHMLAVATEGPVSPKGWVPNNDVADTIERGIVSGLILLHLGLAPGGFQAPLPKEKKEAEVESGSHFLDIKIDPDFDVVAIVNPAIDQGIADRFVNKFGSSSFKGNEEEMSLWALTNRMFLPAVKKWKYEAHHIATITDTTPEKDQKEGEQGSDLFFKIGSGVARCYLSAIASTIKDKSNVNGRDLANALLAMPQHALVPAVKVSDCCDHPRHLRPGSVRVELVADHGDGNIETEGDELSTLHGASPRVDALFLLEGGGPHEPKLNNANVRLHYAADTKMTVKIEIISRDERPYLGFTTLTTAE